jgi:hypothetical protein
VTGVQTCALPISYRERHILEFSNSDEAPTRRLFNSFLSALAIADGPKAGTRSPVAAAKALHLLAPSFFSLWDKKIADAYKCSYSSDAVGAYLRFQYLMRNIVRSLPKEEQNGTNGRSALKLIDEYNYAKFTKGWA